MKKIPFGSIKKVPADVFSFAATVILAFLLILYIPLVGELRDERRAFMALEGQLGQFIEKVDHLISMGSRKLLTSEADISLAIDEITKRAEARGVHLTSISSKELYAKEKSIFQILPIHMKAVSTYKDLGEFLGGLDELKNGIVTVKMFTVKADPKDTAKVKSDLVVHLYVAKKSS